MAKISPESEIIRFHTDYSNYELIDFCFETFKYFDRNGIKIINSRFVLIAEKVQIDTFCSNENIRGLLDGLGINYNDNNADHIRILEKGIIKIPIEVSNFFFLEFYQNSKKYKSLFKKFGSGWYYNETTGLGSGKLLERINDQLLMYTELYLNINIGSYLKINEQLTTIVNNSGSPVLYQATCNEYFVCRSSIPNVSFGNFDKFNNEKIKTFENIKTIESIYLYDNNTLRDLGSIRRIKKQCNLRNSSIKSLGDLKYVDDTLIIEKCDNIKSVENINIKGNLNLRGSEINTLKNVIIKGNLFLNVKFKENYFLENCIIQGQIKFFNNISREY
jgi:hypothetical protein